MLLSPIRNLRHNRTRNSVVRLFCSKLLSWPTNSRFDKNRNINKSKQIISIRMCSCATTNPPLIYISRNIPPGGLKLLQDQGYEIKQWISDDPVPREELVRNMDGVDGLFCLLTDQVDDEVLDANRGSTLKVVSTMSVGYDHIDISACKRRGIPVGFTPGVLTEATAELTLGLLLTTSRRLLEASEEVRNGGWGTWKPLWMCGATLTGSTVGIVGLGRIGLAVAHRLKSFGVSRLLYHGRAKKSGPEIQDLGVEFCIEIDDLLSASDFVVVTCALTEATKELFNKSTFAKMKPSAVFVNTARGGLVNQDDLYDALAKGVIGAAGLDVTTPEPLPPTSPLLQLKNCVILPHIGSATFETRNAMSVLAAQNLIKGIQGKQLLHQVSA